MRKLLEEPSVIQRAYDLVQWYVSILNRLPRDHRFSLGERIIANLYDILEGLTLARYGRDKVPVLERLDARLELVRLQTRLLHDYGLIHTDRDEHAAKLTKTDAGIRRAGISRWQRQGGALHHPPQHEAGVHARYPLDAGDLVEQKVLVAVHVSYHHLELVVGLLAGNE